MSLEGHITHVIASLYDLENVEDGTYLVPVGAVSLHGTENIKLDTQQAQEFARFDEADVGVWDDEPALARSEQLPEGTIRSSEFLHYDVVAGPDDEALGNTEDLVVDLETNEVVYAAIGSGGFLGIGRDYYAISFDRLQVEVAEARVRVDMSEEDFEELEGFDYDYWPREGGGSRRATAEPEGTESE